MLILFSRRNFSEISLRWRCVASVISVYYLVSGLCPYLHAAIEPGEKVSKIGFIKKTVVVDTCKAMLDFQNRMNQVRQASMDQLILAENTLREQESDLKKVQNQISPDLVRQKKTIFDQSVHALRQKTDFLKKQFEISYLKGLEIIQKHIQDVICYYAQQHHYTLIIEGNAVVYGLEEHDLTQAILKRMDETLPKIDIALPAVHPLIEGENHDS